MWAAIGERGKPFLKYVEFQEEKGPKNGVLHLQGYMECNQFIKYNVLKKLLGGEVWLTSRCGTFAQAVHYIRKPVRKCVCKHCMGARDGGGYNGGLKGRWVRPI